MKALIVGAGLAGLTAGVLLRRKKWDVRILETRNHLGGNCWDYQYNGVRVHAYGPHIFHTNNGRVNHFISDFGGLTGYLHKVKANVRMYADNGSESHERLLSIPYNLTTEREIGGPLDDEQIVNLFFRNYSEKMWGKPYDQIPKYITDRVPKRRLDFNDCYFADKYQGMPAYGYNSMFHRMIDEIGGSAVELAVRQHAWRSYEDDADLVVYTGRLDSYYDGEFGTLPYRALKFDFKRDQPRGNHAVINWCDSRPCTRTTDYACFYDNPVPLTVLGDEYPEQWDPHGTNVPSYPMRGFPEVDLIAAQYQALMPNEKTIFCGRLGTYQYMNMDAVISDTMFRLEGKLGCSLYT